MPRCYDGHVRALALLVVCGCRSILGIEDVDVIQLGDPDANGNEVGTGGEMPPDVPNLGCPTMYQALPMSGPRGHRYLQTPTPGNWLDMRDFCAAIGGFLAFPDGTNANNAQLELTALITFSGMGTWIGVTDVGTEGSFRTSLNMPVSAATTSFIQGGNTMQNDCASAQANQFTIEDCLNSHKAVCECVP